MLIYLLIGVLVVIVVLKIVKYFFGAKVYPKNIFLPLPEIDGEDPLPVEEIEDLITLDYHEVKDKTPEILEEKYDAICVGSGISGMASSALLCRSGKRVLILEQHDRLGGYTHEFTEEGRDGVEYNFCPGIHYLGRLNTTIVLPLNVISKGQLKFRSFEGKELYEHGDESFEVKEHGYLKLKETLINRFPEEEEAIEKYYQKMNSVVAHGINYVNKKMSPWYYKPFLMLKSHSLWTKYSNITVSEVMDECGMKNEALRQFFYVTPLAYYNGTYMDKVDFSSLSLVFMGIVHKNIPYCSYKSGGGAFSRAIIPNLGEGSHAICNTMVKTINFRGGRARGVTLETGERISSEIVISCAGYQNTYNMIKKRVQETYLSHIPELIKEYPYCGYFFIVFIGLDAPPEELGMNHGLIVMTGNKSMDIYDHIQQLDPEDDFEGYDDCYLLALSNDVEHEFREKYPRHTKLQIISFMSDEWVKKYEKTRLNQRGNEYEEMKRKLETKVLDIVFKRFPKMEDHVDYVDSGTSITALHYIKTPKGSGYGMVMNAKKWMRMNDEKLVNPAPGLYFCGADILCGIAGGLYTSLNLVGRVLNRNLYLDIAEARKIQKKMLKKKKKI